jgi:Cell wall binding domain 2 (CWB2)
MCGAAIALALAGAVAACGRSPASEQGAAQLNPATPAGSAGAAGEVTKNTSRLGGEDPVADAAAVASATHPGAAPAQRPQAVVIAGRSSWASALAAAVLAGAPLGAPLLYSERKGVPKPTVQALEAMQPTGARSFAGSPQLIELGEGLALPGSYRAQALPATEPYALAGEIAHLEEELKGSRAAQAIVVNAEGDPAFAMPAAGLAAESGAPILLLQRTAVPAPTQAALRRLKPATIYAVGPPQVISASVATALGRYATVKRIAGKTPAANAVAVARFGEGAFGWNVHEPGHGLVFANASRPLDAPAAASLSASGDYAPLLLLESADAIPAPLSEYLEDIRGAYSSQVSPVQSLYNHGWILGDASAVSAATQAQLDALLEVQKRENATPSPATP